MADRVYHCLSMQTCLRHLYAKGTVLLLGLVLTSTALAQPGDPRSEIDSPGLMIEAAIGWDGIADLSTPVPVSFLIQNNSERSVEGTLTLSDPLSGNELTLGTVVISAGSSRRVTSIQAMKNWYDCVVKLSHNEKILWRRNVGQMIGKRFDQNANYVMIVDQGGRRLLLPGALQDTDPPVTDTSEVVVLKNRPIRCLKVKPWQLPNHPGPLCAIQAMVITEGTVERDLNQVQWKSMAEWICLGGTVFVHDKSREIVDRILQLAPLGTEPAIQSGPFAIRRVGLGAVYEYSQQVFSSDSDAIRQSIADAVASLNRNPVNSFADSGNLRVAPERRANKNRFLVAIFFGIYTLLTGAVVLFLFRLSQKQLAGYTVFVVVGASIFSALIGGYLRYSPGDLNWRTLTQSGIGGLVQVGAIEVQSAGSRNTRVAVKGENTDLQWIARDPYWQYREPRPFGYSPFTWQANLSLESGNAQQINVPMTLWGHRRCHATAFRRDAQPLDFELDFELANSGSNVDPAKPAAVPAGNLSVKLMNRLEFDLHDCWLIVGITHIMTPELLAQRTSQRNSQRNVMRFRMGASAQATQADEGLIDLYFTQRLADLRIGETRAQKFQANFKVAEQNGLTQTPWPNGMILSPWSIESRMPPRISRLGTASAWIFGRCSRSPIMEIDQKNSDFVPEEQHHFFIQEIFPEEMPDGLQFNGTGK